MNKVYLLVGVPGSGKSWVMGQLIGMFNCVRHDDYIRDLNGYIEAIIEESSNHIVLAETPFSLSQILGPLEDAGLTVIPVIIYEKEPILKERYFKREGREIPKGHLTRQETYRHRAETYGLFIGTSGEVFKHLSHL